MMEGPRSRAFRRSGADSRVDNRTDGDDCDRQTTITHGDPAGISLDRVHRLHGDDPAQHRRAKRALVRTANVRAAEVGEFAGHWIWDLASAESSAHARSVMQRWRKTWRSERHTERMSSARASMREWLTQTDSTLAEIHADALRRSWTRLDCEQREPGRVRPLVTVPLRGRVTVTADVGGGRARRA
jgi:hypothetical protein